MNVKHGFDYDTKIETLIQQFRLTDHKCVFCHEQFDYFRFLITHMNNVHGSNSFICDDCGIVCSKKRDLTMHIRDKHQTGGYPCEECSEVFESFNRLRNHKNKTHILKCHYCALKFTSKGLFNKHLKAEHPDDGSRKCPYCSLKCHSKFGLSQHMTKCKVKILKHEREPLNHPEAENKEEPKAKQDVLQIRTNIQSVVNMTTAIPFKFFTKFRCFFCYENFQHIDDLNVHTLLEHPVCDIKCTSMKKCKGERVCVKVNTVDLKCKICEVAIDDLDKMIDHIIDEHKANYDKTLTGCLLAFKVYKDHVPCPICNEDFRYISNVLKHMNVEHTNNNIICSFCGKTFRSTANLRAHLSYNHNKDSTCVPCGISFKNSAYLARHKAKHHNAKEHKCHLCDESFASSYKRQKHLIQVHNTGHKCTYCERMFTRNSFMIDHIRRIHYKEKTKPCSVCGEKFFDNYLLRMHMVKHDGERKFHCDVCGKSFLRRSNLAGHMDVHKKQGLQVDRSLCGIGPRDQ